MLQVIEREERVGFIGISNWALDPAKMNRGIMVTRSDPTEQELELTARYITMYTSVVIFPLIPALFYIG